MIRTDISPEGTQPSSDLTAVPIVAAVLLVAKAVLARGLMLADASPLHALLLDGPFILGALCWASLTPRRARSWTVIAVATVITVWLAASVVFASYFGQVPGPLDLRFAGQVGDVGDSVFSLLKPVHLLFLLDLPILVWLAIRQSVRRRYVLFSPRAGRRSRATFIAAVGLTIVAGALIFQATRLPADVNSIPAARARGVFALQLSSLVRSETPAAEVVASSGSAGTTPTADSARIATFRRGSARGANLILIQVEALQSALIGASIDGVEVTPRLNEIAKECWYFPNTLTQISRGNTADAEFIANTGSYAPPGEAASVRWGDRVVPSLPRLLAADGYHTMTFHANTARFWNRINMYSALGFDEYFDRARIGWEPKWKWGSSDEVVFRKGVSEMTRLRSKDTTFYAQFVTMSTHHPFVYPPMNARPYRPAASWADTKLGRYLSSESYVDKAIGGMVDDLKRTGLWDESVVVIYGDHFGFMMPDSDSRSAMAEKALFGAAYDRNEYLAVPLLVHVPGGDKVRRINDTVGQVDILATLADPLGIDLGGFTQFGRDAFVAGRELVGERGLVGSGSVANGRILFVPGIGFEDGNAYRLSDGKTVKATQQDRTDYEDAHARMAASLAYSDSLPKRADAGSVPQGIIPNK